MASSSSAGTTESSAESAPKPKPAAGPSDPAERERWIDLRLRAGKALLKSAEALMAWRHAAARIEQGPRPAMESVDEGKKKLAYATQRRQSLRNFVSKAIKDLDAIEGGDLTITVNQPGAFPLDVDWVTGETLGDGRYRIACPLAFDPLFEDALSLRAIERGNAAQASAIADRKK